MPISLFAESTVMESEDESVSIVKKILDKKVTAQGKIQYLVKWKNFGNEESTWERAECLDCPQLIAAFEKQGKMQKSKKSKSNVLKSEKKGKKEEVAEEAEKIQSIVKIPQKSKKVLFQIEGEEEEKKVVQIDTKPSKVEKIKKSKKVMLQTKEEEKKTEGKQVAQADKKNKDEEVVLVPKTILGITDDSRFKVLFDDESVQLVSFEIAMVEYPELVFEYYSFNLFLT